MLKQQTQHPRHRRPHRVETQEPGLNSRSTKQRMVQELYRPPGTTGPVLYFTRLKGISGKCKKKQQKMIFTAETMYKIYLGFAVTLVRDQGESFMVFRKGDSDGDVG